MHAFRVRRASCSPLRACRRRVRGAAGGRKYRGVGVAAHAPSEARQLAGGRRRRRRGQREDDEEQERDAQRRAQRRGRHRLHKQVHARRHPGGAAGTPRAPAPRRVVDAVNGGMGAALSARSAHVIRSIRFTRGLHTHTHNIGTLRLILLGVCLSLLSCVTETSKARARRRRAKGVREERRALQISARGSSSSFVGILARGTAGVPQYAPVLTS